ncbi:C4-dicarboxylate ABC transporter substrate-binding protein [Bradyrhizobium lablabi]|uniref:C4-dicarboxylate ABC transporter substrate-binding protein n=1 Tax=Bradyrhizobium lablabi TaxID=722472 RepID=A0A0R3N7F5_9BRAD|nr:TAXI family TRAP transporter solute-binding subunit [Bradyrhizobium lablabi]KRR28078.1 C4-dicarboxylate ABC transporter substrate-binding protein [Bradyrhizobium lablabi]
MNPMRLPTWLRIALVAGVFLLVAGAGFLGYRWYTKPTTLTVAVGSLDGEASRLVTAIARKLTQLNAPVRFNMVETGSVLDAATAFASGKVDLAVVRGDVGDLSQAQAVVVVAHAVALLIAPPGSPISDIAGLKRVTVGVVGGDINRQVVKELSDEYDLARANVVFKNLAPAEVRKALETKEVRAILIVMPLAEKYLTLIRNLFPQNAKTSPVLIPIEQAGAIAARDRAYESYDVPKGTLRGAPPVPAEDLTTLRTSFYLVAQKKLSNDLVTDLTQSVMNARRDLLTEQPILAQVTAPDTDADAHLPVHPGAAAFYNGTQESFLDKWGNIIFLAPMIAGGLVSVLAAAWQFLRADGPQTREQALDALYALGRRIRVSGSEAELDEIELEIDRILQTQRLKAAAGEDETRDVTALNVAAHRLENLIHDRRLVLAPQQGGKTREQVRG